jgi:HlyD family secretion protein
MKKAAWFYGAFAFALTVGALAWAFAPRAVDVEVAHVTRGHFESTIDEDGKTRLRDRYIVSAPIAGVLDRIDLREGDTVQQDAVVATLTPTLPTLVDERTLREQQVRVETALANVLRANARVDGARVTLQQAGNEVRRSEELARQGFVAETKLDSDRLAVDAARKELQAAQEEAHVAGHQVEEARTALMAVTRPARKGERVFLLRAPVSGRVLRVMQISEASVPLGAPLLEVGDVTRLEIVAELLTTDAVQAAPGSRVIVEAWGGENTLEGRVRLVEPGGFTKISALGVEEQRVRTLIDITSDPQRWGALGDGYRVGVRIVTREAGAAVKAPVGAVFPQPDGAMAVFTIEDGRARQVNIEVAARNTSEVWVRRGLEPGMVVIVYPPAAVKDGVRVRERRV